MSESRKELYKWAMLAITAVSLLGAGIYYFPQGHPLPPTMSAPLVFAIGSSSQVPKGFDTMYMKEIGLIVTFANGSAIRLYHTGGESTPDGVLVPDHEGEIDAAGLKAIMLYTTQIAIIHHNGPSKILFRWLENLTIGATLLNTGADLGSCNITNDIQGIGSATQDIVSGPKDFEELKLDYSTAGKNWTRYWNNSWSWTMSAGQLAEMLRSSSTPANVSFALDFDMYLKYKITRYEQNVTDTATIETERNVTGDMSLQWSGTWGNIEFVHDAGQILSMRYNFSTMKLNVKETPVA